MKKFLLSLLPMVYVGLVQAQLVIQPGSGIKVQGQLSLVLHNIEAVNDDPQADLSGLTIIGKGGQVAALKGAAPWNIRSLKIDKPAGHLLLGTNIHIADSLFLQNGLLDVGDYQLLLSDTANLWGENNDRRVIASGSGWIQTQRIINNAQSINAANLGFHIQQSNPLGRVTIRRGHQPIKDSANQGSPFRYYQVIPEENPAINASVEFEYLDAELGQLDESMLYLFESADRLEWQVRNNSIRNTATNRVSSAELSALHYFTLAPAATPPLPVFWGLLQAHCEGDIPQLHWQTLQESNTDHFEVERMSAGTPWSRIGQVAAAGESNNTRNYFWKDVQAEAGITYQYRIRSVDVDGRQQLSPVILVQACSRPVKIGLAPVPAWQNTVLTLHAARPGRATVQLIGSDGRIYQQLHIDIVAGNNQRVLDLSRLAAGAYFVRVDVGGVVQTERLVVRSN